MATSGIGEALRRVHWQCWRAEAPPLELSLAELVAVMPVLIRSGSVGLVWPRLRHRAGEYGAVGAALEAAFRSQVAHNALVEQEIARVISRLGEAGVEPVLIKGFAVARLYPAGVVRTAGDIDLVVRDAAYEAAIETLGDVRLSFHRDDETLRAHRDMHPVDSPIDLDLHRFSNWGEALDTSFFAMAQPARHASVEVLVPSPTDHVRALCLHFVRHGAVRPLRLCDIALLGERYRNVIDWERCLSGSRREVEQISVTLRLAAELLGMRVDDVPPSVRVRAVPGWLVPAVLRQWAENPVPPGLALPEVLANPRGIVRTFRRRWPDPVTATLRMGVPFNDVPRLPIQIAAYGWQIGDYAARRLGRQARDRRFKAAR